jgi:hypothetical protein
MRAPLAALACLAACATPGAPEQGAHPLATSPPAWCGREPCQGPFYRSDDLEFGRHLIGEAVEVPEAAVVQGDCLRRRAADCAFVEDGVRYYVARGRVTDMSLAVAHATRLPFGLSGEETPREALAVMQRVTSIPMELSGREDGDHVVAVQGALKNALGEAESFNLVFTPEGRLYFIEMLGPR